MLTGNEGKLVQSRLINGGWLCRGGSNPGRGGHAKEPRQPGAGIAWVVLRPVNHDLELASALELMETAVRGLKQGDNP